MESPPLLLCKGLLLTASLLICWNSPTTAVSITKEMRFSAAEGAKVLLYIPLQANDLLSFSWYKGKDADEDRKIAHYEKKTDLLVFGDKITGREEIYKDGSMMLRDVSQEDAGIYTLETAGTHDIYETTYVYLQVHKIVTRPIIQLNHTQVTKRRSASIFTCVTPDTGIDINWLFNNKPLNLTERVTLSPEKQTLTIFPVLRTDVGIYQCETSNSVSSRKSSALLFVLAYG